MIANNRNDIISSKNLEGVASILGEFKDLENFEKSLKDSSIKLIHY